MSNENVSRWRLFAEISQDDAKVVLGACEQKMLVADEELFHENDEGDSLFIVQSGRVEISKTIRGDVERVLASLGAGEATGEMSFIDGSRRSATARTAESSELLVLTRGAFARVNKERPDVAAAFYRNLAAIMAARLRTTNEMYRDSVAFNLEATGAAALNLKSMVEELRAVTLHLPGGFMLTGRLLQLDHHAAGYTLVIKDANEKISVVPYHAIQRIEIA